MAFAFALFAATFRATYSAAVRPIINVSCIIFITDSNFFSTTPMKPYLASHKNIKFLTHSSISIQNYLTIISRNSDESSSDKCFPANIHIFNNFNPIYFIFFHFIILDYQEQCYSIISSFFCIGISGSLNLITC